MYNRTEGVLRVLRRVLPWVLPSQGRQEDCGCQFWPRLRPAVGLWLSGQCWVQSTLLTMYSLGEAQWVLSTWGWEHGKGYVHGAKEQRQAGE